MLEKEKPAGVANPDGPRISLSVETPVTQPSFAANRQVKTLASGRNVALTAEAGRLWCHGSIVNERDLFDALLSSPVRDGLPESEVRGIAKSIAGKPKPAPRLQASALSSMTPTEELAARRGWTTDALKAMGATEKGRMVSFPMRRASGEVAGYRQRMADGSMFSHSGKKSNTAKGSKLALLGGPWPLPTTGEIMLVEGEADAAAALSAGAPAVVGLPGAKPGPAVLDELQAMLADRQIVAISDPGPVGEEGMKIATKRLQSAGCTVRWLPPAEDVGDLDKRLQRAADKGAELQRLLALAVPFAGGAAPLATDRSGASNQVSGDAPKSLVTITSTQLDAMEFPPQRWLVNGLLPVGATRLAAPPKEGKSFLIYNVVCDLTMGRPALGFPLFSTGDPIEVVWIAAEEHRAHFQRRQRAARAEAGLWPGDRLHIVFAGQFRRWDQGGREDYAAWLKAHPQVRLTVMDTESALRPPSKPGAGIVEAEHGFSSDLRATGCADDRSLIVIAHTSKRTRKNAEDMGGSIFDTQAGTRGGSAPYENLAVLETSKQGREGKLHVRGREASTSIWLLTRTSWGGWACIGDEADQEPELSPQQDTLCAYLVAIGEPRTPGAIAMGASLPIGSVKKAVRRLLDLGVVGRTQGGAYYIEPKAKKGEGAGTSLHTLNESVKYAATHATHATVPPVPPLPPTDPAPMGGSGWQAPCHRGDPSPHSQTGENPPTVARVATVAPSDGADLFPIESATANHYGD